jgi:hypothetical protein
MVTNGRKNGMMDDWNTGGKRKRNNGRSERWNSGIME